MVAAPLLFLTGVAFAYFVVLPPAVHFLQGYNSQNFDILVQAKTYYTFQILTMLGIGLAFQLPLGLLALQRLGAINARTLTRNWRYATVIIAVVAAAMPGQIRSRPGWRCSRSLCCIWPVSSCSRSPIAAPPRAPLRAERLARRRTRPHLTF